MTTNTIQPMYGLSKCMFCNRKAGYWHGTLNGFQSFNGIIKPIKIYAGFCHKHVYSCLKNDFGNYDLTRCGRVIKIN